MPPSNSKADIPGEANLTALLQALQSMDRKLDRLLEDRELIREALNGLQRQVANAIPVIQQLDHMQAIKQEEKERRRRSARAIERMFWEHDDLPRLLAKRRKQGEDIPFHPGQILERDFLLPAKLARNDIAQELGMGNSVFSRFLNEGVRVSPKIAEGLARRFSTTPEFWLELQARYDRWWSEHSDLRVPPKHHEKPPR